LVISFNTVDSSASVFTSLLASSCLTAWLLMAATPNCCLPSMWICLQTHSQSRLVTHSPLEWLFSRCSLCTDPTENPLPTFPLLFYVCNSCCSHVLLTGRCLTMDLC
jgi:hypothetical protein